MGNSVGRCDECGEDSDWLMTIRNWSRCRSCWNSYERQKQDREDRLRTAQREQNDAIQKQKKREETSKKSAKDKCDKMDPKLDAIINDVKNIDTTSFNQDDNKQPNLADLLVDEKEIDAIIGECVSAKANSDETVKLATDLGIEELNTPTYTNDDTLNKNIEKYKKAKKQIIDKKKKIQERIEKVNNTQIETSKNKIAVEEELIIQKENEIKLMNNNKKLDQLRLDLDNINGEERNANPAAFGATKAKFDELYKLLQTKYSENKDKISKLTECYDRILKIQSKLKNQQIKNKYLQKLLDEQYDNLCEAVDGAMKKYEERGTYFLSVTCGLKESIITKFDDILDGDLDLDMIIEMGQDDLIDMGIDNKFIRGKILLQIKQLKKSQNE
eukprot:405055_1